MTPSAGAPAGVVIPIRAFATGKSRLAPQLEGNQRSHLLRAMATRVVEAASPLPVTVVSSAPEVLEWANALGVDVLGDPGSLDAAVAAGRDHLAAAGLQRVVVAHADLPLAASLGAVVPAEATQAAWIVPDLRGDGTPVLSIPTNVAFGFSYGPGSFDRHVREAQRLGLAVVEHRDDPTLRYDVDEIADLAGMPADAAFLLEGASDAESGA